MAFASRQETDHASRIVKIMHRTRGIAGEEKASDRRPEDEG
jgi:hypothetical protein